MHTRLLHFFVFSHFSLLIYASFASSCLPTSKLPTFLVVQRSTPTSRTKISSKKFFGDLSIFHPPAAVSIGLWLWPKIRLGLGVYISICWVVWNMWVVFLFLFLFLLHNSLTILTNGEERSEVKLLSKSGICKNQKSCKIFEFMVWSCGDE